MVVTNLDDSISKLKRGIRSKGSALILVLVFAIIINMIVIFSIESSWLQQQIARNYQLLIENFIDAEASLVKQEQCVMQGSIESKDDAQVAQFIPDTLRFAEMQGIHFYPTTISQEGKVGAKTQLQSTVAKRRIF